MHVDPVGTQQIRGDVAAECDAAWLDRSIYFVVKTWKGAEAEYYQKTGWHSLNLTTHGGTALTGAKVGGELLYEGLDEPGSLTFIPAHVDRHGWAKATDMRLIGLYFHPHVAERLCDADLADIAPRINDKDPLVQVCLAQLADELRAGEIPDLALMEQTLALVIRRLLTRKPKIDLPRTREEQLGSSVLRQITDYVDANLAHKISLSGLAALADMPVFRFARAFKASTGVAPYQYILRRRVRCAEHLLANTETPISEIAFATGFSSQAHLTTAFKRYAGQAPRAYRQSLRR
ncbi:MAG: AraC family transcriptional regulator [Methyloceanibacter sp.]|nr:AraC family transcriptional regulator [Methyloceanibacter sp.]